MKPRIDPRDGWRSVMETVGEGYVALRLVFLLDGKRTPLPGGLGGRDYVELRLWPIETTLEREADRLRATLLAEAVCRYVNTGGNWHAADDLLYRMLAVVRMTDAPVVQVPGHVYAQAEGLEDTRFRHYFVPEGPPLPGQEAVSWEEPHCNDAVVGGLFEFFPRGDLDEEI